MLALSVAAWLAGLFGVAWVAPGGRGGIGLARGAVWLSGEVTDQPGLTFRGWVDWTQAWIPARPRGRWGLTWMVPLWIPATGAGLALGAVWLAGRRAATRASHGLCPSCGYDLTGITGPCPECGATHDPDSVAPPAD